MYTVFGFLTKSIHVTQLLESYIICFTLYRFVEYVIKGHGWTPGNTNRNYFIDVCANPISPQSVRA